MILHLIQKYIEDKVTNANAHLNTAIALKQINTEVDMEMIGASESYIHYRLYVGSVNKGNFESQRVITVSVKMQLMFLIANKNYTIYSEIFDRYVYLLFRILKEKPNVSYSNEDVSSGLKINNLTDLQITNADTIEDDYYKPSIEFTLQIIDKSEIISSQIIDSDAVAV